MAECSGIRISDNTETIKTLKETTPDSNRCYFITPADIEQYFNRYARPESTQLYGYTVEVQYGSLSVKKQAEKEAALHQLVADGFVAAQEVGEIVGEL